MIFIHNRLDWIVRSYFQLDCLSISIAKFYIDWIGLSIGLDWIGLATLEETKEIGAHNMAEFGQI